jgi:hypothetical protein
VSLRAANAAREPCPVEQTHANARLESRHSTADAGLSEPESFSGSDEITGFPHRGQDADAAEQSAVFMHPRAALSLEKAHTKAG